MIRIKIVYYFILYSILQGAKPWKFFQVNAKYFNEEKAIFSKYEIEKNIPKKWKLNDYILDKENNIDLWKKEICNNFTFPLFLKPEWWQNSHWIYRVDDEKYLIEVLNNINKDNTTYLCQELASYEKEFEVLYVRGKDNNHSILSLTETINDTWERYPINWIHWVSKYRDITNLFSEKDKNIFFNKIKNIWDFQLARVWIKADTKESLILWDFKIFEINIFLPLPLSLLDDNINKTCKNIFLKKFAKKLVNITMNIDNKKTKNIFWNMIVMHYKVKFNKKSNLW